MNLKKDIDLIKATAASLGEGERVDWMCILRYALYGAMIGGCVGQSFGSTKAAVVYVCAAIGSLLFAAAKTVKY